MKLWKYLPIVLFFSCINLFIQETQYNSLYFTGGSWIEMARLDSMKMATAANDFTLQFWVSGGEVDTNKAPALFSIVDSTDKTILALLRDINKQDKITTVINTRVINSDVNGLEWSDPENFYLISILFSDNSNVKIYVDSNAVSIDVEDKINLAGEILVVGARANEKRTLLKNFWYGSIDEIRLWNTILTDSTIKFQSEHPDKLGYNYRYTDGNGNEISTYLDSLIGIWRLNFEEPLTLIEDDSEHDNDGNIYTLSGFSVELSEKGAK